MKEQLNKDFNNSIKNLSLSQKDIEIKKFCLDNFIDKGFPNRKEEDWKFSDLNQIIKNNIGELSFFNDHTSTNKVNTLRDKNNSFLIITHYQRLLDYIKPDFVHVLMNGKIVKSGGPDLALELEKKGYENFN